MSNTVFRIFPKQNESRGVVKFEPGQVHGKGQIGNITNAASELQAQPQTRYKRM